MDGSIVEAAERAYLDHLIPQQPDDEMDRLRELSKQAIPLLTEIVELQERQLTRMKERLRELHHLRDQQLTEEATGYRRRGYSIRTISARMGWTTAHCRERLGE